jgi:hypothetical protein
MKRLPTTIRFIGQIFLSLVGAIGIGILAAVIAVYLYDRGTSKGNDVAVALIGLHAVGTFSFPVLLTFLSSRTSYVSWKVLIASLASCFVVLLCSTILFSSAYDDYSAIFFVMAWISVVISGSLAIGMCNYILSRARTRHLSNAADNS